MSCCDLSRINLVDFDEAIRRNHVLCMKRIYIVRKRIGKPIRPSKRYGITACKYGAYKSLVWLTKIEFPLSDSCTLVSCEENDIQCLRYSVENGCKVGSKCFAAALRNRNAEILDYLSIVGCKIDKTLAIDMVRKGEIDYLKYFKFTLADMDFLCNTAVAFNRAFIIEHFVDNGVILTSSLLNFALGMNDKSTLDTLMSRNCPVDNECYVNAISKNNLDAVKYIFEKSESRLYNACSIACIVGDLNILHYLHSNNFPWDESTMLAAYRYNNFHCLHYLIANGCPTHASLKSVVEQF